MLTRYIVWLDNVSLDSLDSSIYITDIEEMAPRYDVTTAARMHLPGQRVISNIPREQAVRIAFLVRDRYIQRRQMVLEDIRKWCRGRILQCSHRPEQQLHVVCTDMPGASALLWADELEMTFTAYDPPLWESRHETKATFPAGQTTGEMVILGSASYTSASALMVNESTGTIDSLSISTELSTMSFSELGLLPGETLAIDYDDNGHQRMRIQGSDGQYRSVYGCRTAESSDELLVPCGEETPITKPEGVSCTITARGRYV